MERESADCETSPWESFVRACCARRSSTMRTYYGGGSVRKVKCAVIFLLFVVSICRQASAENPFSGRLQARPQNSAILFNTTFDLHCILNFENFNNTENLGSWDITASSAMPENLMEYERELVNDSLAIFHINNLDRGTHHIYCSLQMPDTILIDGLKVFVGDLPAKVDAVNCTVPLWEGFTCEWEQPYNFIETNYTATVQYHPRVSGRVCHIQELEENLTSCYLMDQDFLASKKICVFRVIGKNLLGSTISVFPIDQYNVTIPPAPTMMIIDPNITYDSVKITIKITKNSMLFPGGYGIDAEYNSVFNKTWTTGSIALDPLNNPDIPSLTFRLTHLPYAGIQYNLRVYLRTVKYRSMSIEGNFSTLSLPPSSSPLATAGIFEFNKHNEITIYWRELDVLQWNSPNISYAVSCYEADTNDLPKITTNTSYAFAKFVNLSDDINHVFRIHSLNDVHSSVNYTELHVPRFQSVPNVKNVVVVIQNNGTYTVFWNRALSSYVTYTVFYCEENRDHNGGFCKGQLLWENVDGTNVTIHTSKLDEHIFGVAAVANEKYSSGFSWATCRIREGQGDNIVQTFSRTGDMHSSYAVLYWTLGCIAPIQISGYNISYCETSLSYSSETSNKICKDTYHKWIKLADPNQNMYNLTGLLPFSSYIVSIGIILKGEETTGLTKSILVSTTEDEPDSPRDFAVVKVDHNSVTLEWKPPIFHNGLLQEYIISFISTSQDDVVIPMNTTHYTMSGLKSSTQYTIQIKVCNVAYCSLEVETKLETLVYYPETMEMPHVTVLNETAANLSWNPPGGLHVASCYYEVKMEKMDFTKYIHRKFISFQCSARSGIVDIDEFCWLGDGQINYQIRAVNKNLTLKYAGNFSKPHETPCVFKSKTLFYIIILLIIFILVLLGTAVTFSFLVRRKFIQCKPLRPPVSIALPFGIDRNEVSRQQQNGSLLEETKLTAVATEKTPLQCVKDDELVPLDRKQENQNLTYQGNSAGRKQRNGYTHVRNMSTVASSIPAVFAIQQATTRSPNPSYVSSLPAVKPAALDLPALNLSCYDAKENSSVDESDESIRFFPSDEE